MSAVKKANVLINKTSHFLRYSIIANEANVNIYLLNDNFRYIFFVSRAENKQNLHKIFIFL